jgi:hypothetical protein
MVSQTSNLTTGRTQVGLSLKDGQLPAGLQVGDHISIYQVSDAPESCPGSSGGTLAANAVVLSISRPASTSSSAVADVRVAINPADSGAVACNASNGIAGIAILPTSGRVAAGSAAQAQPSQTQPSQTQGTTTPGGQASPTASPSAGTG